MERSKRDLEALVSSQKEQLARYEKRLKDVVTAYKGLLKEKEALETSLTALTSGRETVAASDATDANVKIEGITTTTPTAEASDSSENMSTTNEDKDNLQTQIRTLMNSLATLSAEKSRMEASFQADKKQLRSLLMQKDQAISELQTKLKENEAKAKANVEEVKAKWIIERQERERETNNQMLMIRELQKLYADERHLKENIEMQLNNFKTQFASNESTNNQVRDLQQQLKEAKAQLRQLNANSAQNADMANNAAVLKQVQQEMQQLKEQHAIAIKNEQRRVQQAEEQSRRQAALHEDRVANLESRLAELSSSVGNYDRLRQQDQDSIQILKRKLQELERNTEMGSSSGEKENDLSKRTSIPKHDIAAIVDEIVRLKKLLLTENARSANPIDMLDLFNVHADHVHCQEELNHVQHQVEAGKAEIAQLQERIQVHKSHISTLQEKVKVLNRNIDEQELELKQQGERLRHAVKEERAKWKDALTELEHEYRSKTNELEQELQKQRQRSLQLLEEKEQEIKTLQTSFEVFHHHHHHATKSPSGKNNRNETGAALEANGGVITSDAESNDDQSKIALKSSKRLSVGENCHMLYYANEIARKDIEIAGLRKAKYAAETSLRKAIQDKVTAQEELCDKIAELEEQVDRLQRCQTREGANLEYLKNVIISFIVTKDAEGKKHMLNAISTVLQFTSSETQAVNAAFHKK